MWYNCPLHNWGCAHLLLEKKDTASHVSPYLREYSFLVQMQYSFAFLWLKCRIIGLAALYWLEGAWERREKELINIYTYISIKARRRTCIGTKNFLSAASHVTRCCPQLASSTRRLLLSSATISSGRGSLRGNANVLSKCEYNLGTGEKKGSYWTGRCFYNAIALSYSH